LEVSATVAWDFEWLMALSAGHATWMVLRDEPRITLGIPIVGCPDYISLLTPRIAKFPPSTGQRELAAPAFPASLAQLVTKDDPCAADYRSHDPAVNPYIGKQILILGGGEDRLVPPKFGEKMFRDMYVGSEGAKEMIVQDGIGHAMSPEMLERVGEWLWKYGVNDGAAGSQTSQL
jgi:pimeloyl-ACP methyl ester carboxylesterase